MLDLTYEEREAMVRHMNREIAARKELLDQSRTSMP